MGTYVHVKCVDREVIGAQVQRLKHLCEGEVLAVTEDHHLIRLLRDLPLNESQEICAWRREYPGLVSERTHASDSWKPSGARACRPS